MDKRSYGCRDALGLRSSPVVEEFGRGSNELALLAQVLHQLSPSLWDLFNRHARDLYVSGRFCRNQGSGFRRPFFRFMPGITIF